MGLLIRGHALAFFGLLVATGCQDASPQRAPHTGMDVVVVLIDTLRPDHLGFYGHERETAPFLAELAEDAVVFERAYSTSSWTAPANPTRIRG